MITEQIQIELSSIIHKDIVKIATSFTEISALNPNLVKELILHINLLEEYKVTYIQNEELEEIFQILINDLQTSLYPVDIAFVTSLNYLLKKEKNLEEAIFIQVFFNVPDSLFLETFFIFEIFANSIQKLFEKIILYIFNLNFLKLNENIQIEAIYKMWNLSLSFFHDNEASKYAYKMLLKLFHQALHYKKTEVAFWLYYNPLHYFKSGTTSNIDKANEEFKNEVEKPLEKYILQELIPKYNLTANEKPINKNKKIKVAFVMQRIIKHSTIDVLYSLIKALMNNKNSQYEFIIYDLSFSESEGSDKKIVEKFKKLGIKYIDLQYEIFGNFQQVYSLVEKCIKTREILIKDQVDILIGLHTRVEYIFLYATRTAPKQVYWYHSSNAQYDIKGIDYRIKHGFIGTKKEIIKDITFLQFPDYILKEHLCTKIDERIITNLRNSYSKDMIILGTIGRLVKIENEEYLNLITKVMKENKNVIYLACGAGDKELIVNKIKDKDILDRWFFPGHINSLLYSSIIDIWPNTFPNNQGLSTLEAVAKGALNIQMITNYFSNEDSKLSQIEVLFQKNNHSFQEILKEKDLKEIIYEYLRKNFFQEEECKQEEYIIPTILYVPTNSLDSYYKKLDYAIKNFDNLKNSIKKFSKVMAKSRWMNEEACANGFYEILEDISEDISNEP